METNLATAVKNGLFVDGVSWCRVASFGAGTVLSIL